MFDIINFPGEIRYVSSKGLTAGDYRDNTSFANQDAAARRRLHQRLVHGGCAMGGRERHRGFAIEGVILSAAGRVCEGDHAGQAGDEERVRMSGLQDQNARSYVRLDVQFEDP